MAKTVSFGVMHMTVAFGVVYAMTGSLAVGGAVAFVEPLVNTVGYFFHEKVWSRIQGGDDATEASSSAAQLAA